LTAIPTPKAPTVEPEEELPQIDEATVNSYSQEVRVREPTGLVALKRATLMAHRNGNRLQQN
jgi:hypothetical protein